jgi:AraC family transcriptional regulator of adaptative response / DNA-3-methyladenine glycosylase II
MPLDHEQCYQVLVARDTRFDGQFFVGVSTTGIYCRPICPARTPRADRCKFFASAAAAERRGFRPCLRCRPELAPLSNLDALVFGSDASYDAVRHTAAPQDMVAPVDAMRARARKAGERIASGALDGQHLDVLARELGTSARHLRRAVERELGASPVALAQTRRLLTAKQLLTDTTLPIAQVALASGFGSLRRFNALFQSQYRMAPTALRKNAHASTSRFASSATRAERSASSSNDALLRDDFVRVSLSYRPPFAWGALMDFLAARAIPGVEVVTAGPVRQYWRTIRVRDHVGVLGVSASSRANAVQVEFSHTLLPVLVPLLAQVRQLLDLDASPASIDAHLKNDSLLAETIATTPGRRVPGCVDAFELAVRAVLGQQVSVRGATTLSGRLIELVAEPIASINSLPPHALSHAPITAERLADTSIEAVMSIGLPRARAATLVHMARAVADGSFPLLRDTAASTTSTRVFVEEFTSLNGIGPWTAQYVAMRAWRSPDAFPEGDLALRKAAGGVSNAELRRLSERCRPWRAYAAMYLWARLS